MSSVGQVSFFINPLHRIIELISDILKAFVIFALYFIILISFIFKV